MGILKSFILFIFLLQSSVVEIMAEVARWYSTTQQAGFVDKGVLEVTNWNGSEQATVEINTSRIFQTIDGWGGCINELGWDAMQVLTSGQKDSVLTALFDPVKGCGFNMGRIPIGSSDYSKGYYSNNDVNGDYSMTQFSLTRDSELLIPYIKASLKISPQLRFWGSPWSPPGWLKTNNS